MFTGRVAAGLLLIGCALPAADPLVPKASDVTAAKSKPTAAGFAEAFERASGLKVRLPRAWEPQAGRILGGDTWGVLDSVASASGGRYDATPDGSEVAFAPSETRAIAATAGAFRGVLTDVELRRDLVRGAGTLDLRGVLHWEPRLRVFRLRPLPGSFSAEDDSGRKLVAGGDASAVRVEASAFPLSLRFAAPGREAKGLKAVSAGWTATLAETMLAFEFSAREGKQSGTKEGVTVSATVTRGRDLRLVTFEASYPDGFPAFESFEESMWTRDNRVEWVSPGGRAQSTDNYEVAFTPQGGKFVYRFAEKGKSALPADLAGWTLRIVVPGVMTERTLGLAWGRVELP